MNKMPGPTYAFDGNADDLRKFLAIIEVRHIIHAESVPNDQAKIADAAGHFTGPVLDWFADKIAEQSTYVGVTQWSVFKTELERRFGMTASTLQVRAQAKLSTMKQDGPILEFLADFERTAELAGSGDVTKSALLPSKTSPRIRKAIEESGQALTNWNTLRSFVINVASRTEDRSEPGRKRRARCGKCGKRGHTASQCSGQTK